MAGRPRRVRSIQSYINHSDTHSGLGPMKAGSGPKIGVTHYLWYNLQTQTAQGPLDFVNNPAYNNTLQWRVYGRLGPTYGNVPFRPSPRQIVGVSNYTQN